MKQELLKRFSISLNNEKYSWLVDKAKQGNRSMSGQINDLIDKAMQKEEAKTKAV